MGRVEDIFLRLSKQLMPNGRAWKIFPTSSLEKLYKGLARGEARFYAAANSLKDSSLPDNSNYDAADAAVHERWLGITPSAGVDLDTRKKVIRQKLAFPGTIRPRQNWRFVEAQLRAAGFDVHVYENRFDDGMGGFVTKTPGQILGVGLPVAMHGFIQHGQAQHGQVGSSGITKCVNYLEESKDAAFVIGSNFRSTFYIAGATLTTFANVDARRKREFRELILHLKPLQAVGILFVNYV